ncbi:hypothetical protein GJ700_25905 [Duganella sp. FT92W]|uniref:TonB family protein n=1 Tax=Pseudoduganella rivuli TaxID=2666085 RepID=A0A7X2ISH2_9BURK|nr:energy transducer TonB [Pseudoduganella rivuli]MRV75155.1 hypothetical protein [Pseudoduganella rivuli]
MSDSEDLPWFLRRLALDGSADQRTIRRAYAREVKRIDQAADAEGFQQLRAAYETALQWEEYQRYYAQQGERDDDDGAAGASPETAPAAAPVQALAAQDAATANVSSLAAAPGPIAVAPSSAGADLQPVTETAASAAAQPDFPLTIADVDPQQLSADVFEAFIAGCSGLAQGRTLHDAPAWEQHLRTCLHDDRLVNLAARAIFEARVLHLLAGGWRPGHETLLEAAADVFEWRSDRHRLRRFGHAGAIVDRAIDERSMFDNQDGELKSVQRQVIQRLRDSDTPDPGQLRNDMPHAEQLAARFPTWLELVASADNLEQWRLAHAALPAVAQPPGYGAVPSGWQVGNVSSQQATYGDAPAYTGPDTAGPSAAQRIKRIAKRFALGFVAFNVAMVLLRVFVIDDAPSGKSPPAAVERPRTRLDIEYEALEKKYAAHRAEREAREALQRQAAQANARPEKLPEAKAPVAPGKERIAEIRSRIRYRLTHMEPPGDYRSEFTVQLDSKGKISNVTLRKPSGLPQYDAAVERAIRDTEPFPPDTMPKFLLSYGMEIVLKPAAPAQGQPANTATDTATPETPPQ